MYSLIALIFFCAWVVYTFWTNRDYHYFLVPEMILGAFLAMVWPVPILGVLTVLARRWWESNRRK